MTTPFILMTLACVIMTITISLQWHRIKQQENLISDLSEKGFREVMGYGKVYRRRYRYIKIEEVGDYTLNNTAEKYHEEGYDLDREKSTDRLLVFVKSEEVTSEAPKDKNERPGEVFLCILHSDDRNFNMVTGCFYDEEMACRYAFKSKDTTVQCIKVE